MSNELSDAQILEMATRVGAWKRMNSERCESRNVCSGYFGSSDGFEVETHFSPKLFKKHNYVIGIYSNGIELVHSSLQASDRAREIYELAKENIRARNHTTARQETKRLIQLLSH